MSSDNANSNKQFTFLRIIHSIFLASILLYILIAILFPKLAGPIFANDDSLIRLIEISLGLITVIILLMVYFWPKLYRVLANSSSVSVISFHIVRIAYIESIAIFGLLLAILGSAWYIWIWFFVVSAAALILTFPTDERISNWTQNQPPTE